MASAVTIFLMAATSPPTHLTTWSGESEAVLDWLQSGLVHPRLSTAQKAREWCQWKQVRGRERRLECNFHSASILIQRRPPRSDTMKVSTVSGEDRPVLLGTRSAPPWVCRSSRSGAPSPTRLPCALSRGPLTSAAVVFRCSAHFPQELRASHKPSPVWMPCS